MIFLPAPPDLTLSGEEQMRPRSATIPFLAEVLRSLKQEKYFAKQRMPEAIRKS